MIKINSWKNYDKAFLKLEFVDDGMGIPDNKKQLLFQNNFEKKINLNNNGLGFTLVNLIIKFAPDYHVQSHF